MTIDKKVLYEIKMPLGLLDPEIAQALKDSGGPWELYDKDGWVDAIFPGGRSGAARYLTYRLKRTDPPMTTDEFIALAVQRLNGWNAVKAWDKGNYDEALSLIGYTPEARE